MPNGNELYDELNRRWKTTCKVVLGEEVGEFHEFGEWLSEHNRPRFSKKSAISEKKVSLVLPHYANTARFVSLDEVDFNKKFEPLRINEVKDIDSIIGAVRERAYYAGNIQLGNSRFIEGSTDVIESFYVYDSTQISFSKHIAYGYIV
ncbi:MAG: hypothetical protein NT157_01145, partial [Candidatus Micrarchaeota archaeon]|nr:hypothetical protein [Candidatus Micrarchaeota archaeon]